VGQSIHQVTEHLVLVRNCTWGDYMKKGVVKFQVFWDVTLCYWVSSYGCFKGSYCLCLQGQVVLVLLDIEDGG
jgi:hypothetical protein